MWSSSFQASSLVLVALLAVCHGFYMPGVTEVTYKVGERVPLMVNKLTSAKTQLPYKYYTPLLSFCKPAKLHDKNEILGEILRGDKIENSLYEILAIAPDTEQKDSPSASCRILNSFNNGDPYQSVGNAEACTNYANKQLKHFTSFIKDSYRVQWIMDNLPAAYVRTINGKKTYETGFLLGEDVGGRTVVNNHVDITVVYGNHADGIVIIGFEVRPSSIDHSAAIKAMSEDDKKKGYKCADFDAAGTLASLVYVEPLDGDQKTTPIYWSYRVYWEKTDTPWTKRWDIYLASTGAQIHWISIVNSLMIVLFLTGMVAMIMMRTLRADLRRYNQQDLSDDEGETGWKLVHGDVFRPPSHPMALAVLIGSGVQVFGMTVVTMSFAVLGFLSPAQRGMLVTAFVVLFVFMGVFAGYFATRCYKTFKGTHWKRLTLNTAFAFPGAIFVIFFILNICEWAEKSSGGIPFGTLVSLMALWFGISVPLVFFGSYFGQRKPLPEDPVRTNQIPRQVPEQVWYMSPLLSILMGGILPFGAVFIELFFILSSLWGNQLYYIFGFLFIVFVILVLTCAEITVVMCYFQLCAEDYHWWWRSFLTAGASAFYMFLYSIFYFATSLQIDKFVSVLLYFGYTLIMALAFFVLTGTIGFYACYYFVRKIYSSIHVD